MTGAPWWVTLAVAAVTAIAALGGTAIATWRQNRRAGREEWFRRLQWAEQLAADQDIDRQARGRAAMNALAESRLATPEDLDFIASITDLEDVHALEETLTAETVDAIDFIEDTEDSEPEETP